MAVVYGVDDERYEGWELVGVDDAASVEACRWSVVFERILCRIAPHTAAECILLMSARVICDLQPSCTTR